MFVHLDILVKHNLNLNVKLANNSLQNEIIQHNALRCMRLKEVPATARKVCWSDDSRECYGAAYGRIGSADTPYVA